MNNRLLLTLIVIGGILATLFGLAVASEIWMSFPPANLAEVKQTFWQQHPTEGPVHVVAGAWALYLLVITFKAWPLMLVLLAGGLATTLLFKRYANEEAMAYMERIFSLETNLNNVKKERDDLAEQWDHGNLMLDKTFEGSGELWLVLSRDGRIRRWNQASLAFATRFHPTLETLEGRYLADLWRGFLGSPLANLLADPKPKAWHGEMKLADDGIHLLCWVWPLGDDVAFLARDISSAQRDDNHFKQSEAMLRSMVEQSLRPLVVMDTNWRYLYVAQSWTTFFHLDTQTALVGKLHPQVIPSFPTNLPHLAKQLESGQRVGAEEEKLTIAGREEVIKWAIRPWRDAGNRLGGYIMTLTPITELVRLRAQVQQGLERENLLAYSDTLTGLPNRQLFNDRLAMALATAYRQLSKVALIFVDLDGFKKVNDTLGHDYGDLLLKQVAARLKSTLRDTDTVARLGGDEFVIILGVRDKTDAELVSQKIIKLLGTPFDLNGKTANIGGSLGIALYPANGNTAAELIKKADSAMYEAKHGGKNTYRFA